VLGPAARPFADAFESPGSQENSPTDGQHNLGPHAQLMIVGQAVPPTPPTIPRTYSEQFLAEFFA
jgi:hypothetical protein